MPNPSPCPGSGREAATLGVHGGRARCPDCRRDVRVHTEAGDWPVLADHNGDGVAYPEARRPVDPLAAIAAAQAAETADQLDAAAADLAAIAAEGQRVHDAAIALLRDRAHVLRQAAADRGRTV